MKRLHSLAAFTLLELLMVLAIVITLTTIAIPQYQKYVQKGNRGDGISLLQTMLSAQERYYTDTMSYTTDLTKLGYSTSNNVLSERGMYKISARQCGVEAVTRCIELIATAQGNQAADGNLVTNTRGLQERVVGSVKEKW